MSTDVIAFKNQFNALVIPQPIKRKSIKTMIMKKSKRTCPICLEGFKENQLIKKLPCQHIFHRCCMKEWQKKSKECPLCRSDFSE